METLIERIAIALERIADTIEPKQRAVKLELIDTPSEPAPLGGKTQTTVDIATRDTADLREQIGRTK